MDFWLTLASNILIASAALVAVYVADILSAKRKENLGRQSVEQELRGIATELDFILRRIAYAWVQFHFYANRDITRQRNVVSAQRNINSSPDSPRAMNDLKIAQWYMDQNDEQVRFWRNESHTSQLEYIHVSSKFIALLTKTRHAFPGDDLITEKCVALASLDPIQPNPPGSEIVTEDQLKNWADSAEQDSYDKIGEEWVSPLNDLITSVQSANSKKGPQKMSSEESLLKIVVNRFWVWLVASWNEPWD